MRQQHIPSPRSTAWKRILSLFFLLVAVPSFLYASWYDSFRSALSSTGSALASVATGAATGALATVGNIVSSGTLPSNNPLLGNNTLMPNNTFGSLSPLAQCRMLAATPGGMYSPQYQMRCQNAALMCMESLEGRESPQMDPYCATVLGYGVNTIGPWGGGFTTMSSGASGVPGAQAVSNATSDTLGWSVPVPANYFAPSGGAFPGMGGSTMPMGMPMSMGDAASAGFLQGFTNNGGFNSFSNFGKGLLSGLTGAGNNMLNYYQATSPGNYNNSSYYNNYGGYGYSPYGGYSSGYR